ncbi:MAG: DUF3795 domain-containing protein [Sedimentisphaerales bacterium]|nr:DUF3795 domain-containing protein [Sedimentisphaerales bacterium]
MEPIYAKCGIRCDLCPVFETNLTGPDDRQRISAAFKTYYEFDVPAEQIQPCPGCQAVTEPPDKDCPEWHCAREKGVETCAHCDEFICEKCRPRMDAMDEFLKTHDSIPPDDYERFVKPFRGGDNLRKIRQSLES